MTEIELPWPPSQLFPNYRNSHHWSRSDKQRRNARTLAWGLTAQQLGPLLRKYEAPERLPVRIQVAAPKRGGRTPDDDGIKGACKAYLDGISDALGVDDKRFSLGAIEWLPKEGAGKVVISF